MKTPLNGGRVPDVAGGEGTKPDPRTTIVSPSGFSSAVFETVTAGTGVGDAVSVGSGLADSVGSGVAVSVGSGLADSVGSGAGVSVGSGSGSATVTAANLSIVRLVAESA